MMSPESIQGTEDKKIRILLVDDEEGYVAVLAKRLVKRNFDVKIALSGSEAVRIFRNTSFDIAVVDLKMDDMDGIEVLKAFKALEPKMPVIILTGHGSETAAREGIAYGAFDYLIKPCELSELIACIKEACAENC